MRRLLRRTFDLAAFACALLFMTACVVWVQSYRRPAMVRLGRWMSAGPADAGGVSGGPFDRYEVRWLDGALTGRCEWLKPLPPGWRPTSQLPARWLWSCDAVDRHGSHIPDWNLPDRWPPRWPRGTRLGPVYYRQSDRLDLVTTGEVLWRCPLWVLCAVTAAAPAVWLRGRFRRRRRCRSGHCTRCGYDMRATPDRCPECGAANRRGSRRGNPPGQFMDP